MRRPETAIQQYRAIGLSLYAKELAPRQRREKNRQLATLQTIDKKLGVVYLLSLVRFLHFVNNMAF